MLNVVRRLQGTILAEGGTGGRDVGSWWIDANKVGDRGSDAGGRKQGWSEEESATLGELVSVLISSMCDGAEGRMGSASLSGGINVGCGGSNGGS